MHHKQNNIQILNKLNKTIYKYNTTYIIKQKQYTKYNTYIVKQNNII